VNDLYKENYNLLKKEIKEDYIQKMERSPVLMDR
jgi:hypothetical protein